MNLESLRVSVPEGTSGDVRVERFTVGEDADSFARRWELIKQGRDCPPGTYTRLVRGKHIWMSDTPAECMDHLEAVWKIQELGGRVLVNGLGLGVIVQAALTCKLVEHVDVVEIDEDVINLVGPTYAGDRCTIHHADAYTIRWPNGIGWQVAWHDIWREMNEDDLPDRTRLLRRYGHRVDWQACWGQDTILAERRRAANEPWRY